MKITVFDTPGLADGTGNDERYLRQIVEKVTKVDLFLFCTDMTAKRFGDDDARTIKKLTKTFGVSLWDHALVVLTFANEVHTLPPELDVTEKDHCDIHLWRQRIRLFKEQILRFQKKIQKLLLSEGVHQEAVSNLPFVPAGRLTKPRLPDRDNWLTAFWIAAFKRISGNAKVDFLLANIDRITISCGGLLCDFSQETNTRRDDERRCSEESIDEDNFWTSLKRSSPVISTSDGKHYQELLLRIQRKQLKLKLGDNPDSDSLCKKRGSLRRSSASVTRDARDRFRRRMERNSLQLLSDEKECNNKTKNTGYRSVDSDNDDDDCCDEDNNMRRIGRLSVPEWETEKYAYSPKEPGQTLYSLPPAYDEVVGNSVPLPMDDSSTQELIKEMMREAISNKQTVEYVGGLVGQSGFSRIYAEFFAKIVELVKRLFRGKKTQKHEM